jgi:hypothetical protein
MKSRTPLVAILLVAIAIPFICCAGLCVLPSLILPSRRDTAPIETRRESSERPTTRFAEQKDPQREESSGSSVERVDDKRLKPLKSGDDVVLHIDTRIIRNRVVVFGDTNLPPGTQLGISVNEEVASGFYGQSSQVVGADQRFESVTFGPTGGLEPGRYEIDVTMPVARAQPSHVRAIIGEKGENLTGPLVQPGPLNFGSVVRLTKHIVIGGTEAVAQQRQRLTELVNGAEQYIANVRKLKAELERARKELMPNSKNSVELAKWGEFARQFNTDQQNLYKSSFLDSLPTGPLKLELGCGCAYLWDFFNAIIKENSVECSKWSREIDDQLEQAEKELREIRSSLSEKG